MEFFETPALAERAGYRPCRRCKPGESSVVVELQRALEDRADAREAMDEVSHRSRVTVQHLRRIFKTATGVTPDQYARARRVERLKTKLRSNGRDVSGAIFAAGYGSGSRVYERTNQTLGMTPATYGRGGKGAVITYEVIDCSMGKLLVATTPRGVCAVKLGDAARELIDHLHEEFPAAAKIAPGKVPSIGQVLNQLDGRATSGDIPLDVRGTTFQRAVWTALCAIPRGQTRSYRQLAEALGRPTAARAVARACATNPVALIVPCHRVVRGSGELSGYRWGPKRKRELLQRESK